MTKPRARIVWVPKPHDIRITFACDFERDGVIEGAIGEEYEVAVENMPLRTQQYVMKIVNAAARKLADDHEAKKARTKW